MNEIEEFENTLEPPHKPTVQRVRYTHDGMIDLIVAQPWISQGEIARVFGYTESWVSIVFSSDAFRERLVERKKELVDPTILVTIEEKWRAVTNRSLEILGEKLAKHSSAVPDNLALKVAEIGAKALGTGGNAPQTNNVQVDHLTILANRLVALRGQTYTNTPAGGNLIEGECCGA